ncbi:MAG: excisionase family DNA-binding protein [Candidatus Eisenbacteria bacterium]|uniref:Excisionase family DNA-binding protein n=1 Tax=Eiseniibacteriota bacterium TaxID=2212470 RepID=A0A937XF98_UNCEI|nr:excisionase family DNA-binding protein [Candidatus Eisenbacteria bacterium]MBM3501514.1 helix-turn-helix domain-containing protein [Armatimonadota bacterium]
MPSPHLTPSEAARALGVSRSYVLWLADTRRIRATRTPTGRRLISRRAVEHLAAERALKQLR